MKLTILTFLICLATYCVYTTVAHTENVFVPKMEHSYQPKNPINKPTATEFPTPTPHVYSEERLFDLVQEWRIENNLQSYSKSNFLCSIAETRLRETKLNWSHVGFTYERFCETCYLGENLSRQFLFEDATLQSWLNSPSHKANLTANYTHSCIMCDATNNENYCVQIFGYY